MTENLVRFSYHTPKAVLEDLIRHEMQSRAEEEADEYEYDYNDNNDNELEHGEYVESADDPSDEGSMSSLSCEENHLKSSGSRVNDSNNVDAGDDDDSGEGSRDDEGDGTGDILPSDVGVSTLPECRQRDSCLLFVDVSGFTRLSTILDVESLSNVMNGYFEMITSEIAKHGGDTLKFAGDALFAEWKVSDQKEAEDDTLGGAKCSKGWALEQLDLSLSTLPGGASTTATTPLAVLTATRCAASIVAKFSDFEVSIPSSFSDGYAGNESAMLNVHCGLGCGRLNGVHVGDYEGGGIDGQEENAVELRREYLFLGSAIDQVSEAAHGATDGQVFISPEALRMLANQCPVPQGMMHCQEPSCIAMRGTTFVQLSPLENGISAAKDDSPDSKLRKYCKRLRLRSLARLHLQASLYVHPVVRGDILSTPNTRYKYNRTLQHKAEAELRSVYTMFIKAMVPTDLSEKCVLELRNIMHVVSTELDRFSGQLRQFIVDDKGCVLIAVFGLRGSTFPDLVANNALPATFSIRRALQARGVHSKIGATFGQVYCGVVGGCRRHEFSVMGAAVVSFNNVIMRTVSACWSHIIVFSKTRTLRRDSWSQKRIRAFSWMRAFRLKHWKSLPLRSWALLRRKGTRGRSIL